MERVTPIHLRSTAARLGGGSESAKERCPKPAIELPRDQYAHEGALVEWWWHVGTLETENGRKFGFEVNAAASLAPEAETGPFHGFTQIAITDVEEQKHYQIVNDQEGLDNSWAPYDREKPWKVHIDGSASEPGNGAVTMESIEGDPLNMHVKATFTSQGGNGKKPCVIDLKLKQEGPEMLVWGNGCRTVYPDAPLPIQNNNYYYSLTHLVAEGTLNIGDTTHRVTGVTWMDHEYGAWGDAGTSNTWTFQNAQFDDGRALSSYTPFNHPLQHGVTVSSTTTFFDGKTSHLIDTKTTPLKPQAIDGKTYFMRFEIEFPDSMRLVIKSLYPDQVFVGPGGAHDGYEGVAECEVYVPLFSISEKKKVFASIATGTAWIEQVLGG